MEKTDSSMEPMQAEARLILIGGSSHAGKSTLARKLGAELGWEVISTDKLARHPGRPWRTVEREVPPHVVEHYRDLSPDELLADVLAHYRGNVVPTVMDIIRTRADDGWEQPLILEGSALWPESLAGVAKTANVRAVWLTAGDRCFEERIFAESGYDTQGEAEKHLIRQFLARTLLFNQRMRDVVEGLGLVAMDVESEVNFEYGIRRLLDGVG